MREELDFKSLRFFSALYRLGNVSPAADALDISQPTGSLLLKKLRDHFADPLFVRVGQRMIPTPRADAIAPTISTLLQLADNDLAVKPEFLPQLIVFVILFFAATFIMALINPSMIADFTACGGIIMLATGFRLCGIRAFPTANMLPSLILVMPFSAAWQQFIA